MTPKPITIPELQQRLRELRESLDFQKRLTHHATCEVRQLTASDICRRDTIDKLNARIQELEATGRVCQWDYDDMDNRYDTDCGRAWMFTEGSLRANGVVFCPFCGGKVTEEPSDE